MFARCVLCLALVSTAHPMDTSAAEIRTIAGSGRQTYSGDDGPAIDAGIGQPFGVTIGPDGALYVCEVVNHTVRRVDERTGFITTVAGSGKKGYDGDGGAANRALCNEPYEVRFDQAGNMYFVEMQNHLVRKVDAQTKKISTIVGNGTSGFSGDGGPAKQARLKTPHSIALDGSGSLFICDIGNQRVRRIDLQTGTIETFAGTGDREKTPDGAPLEGTPLNGPRAIDFDTRGRMYLALREGNMLFRIDLRQPKYELLAGTGSSGYSGDGGPAIKAKLMGPKGVAIGPGGDVYLADTESHTVRVVRALTGKIETVVGDGTPGDGPDGNPLRCRLHRPHGVYVDARGNLYIGDTENHKVRKLTPGP